MTKLRVLIVDDSDIDAQLMVRELRREHFEVTYERVDTAGALSDALRRAPWDVVLCDYSMPTLTLADALRLVHDGGDVPVIVVSGVIGEEAAVDCMRAGAHDFVLKDRLARLAPAVRRELAETRVHTELRLSRDALERGEKVRLLGEMSAGIAHDLRNLLNTLSVRVQYLERAFARDRRPEVEESIRQLKNVIGRGIAETDRIRSFGKRDDRPLEDVHLDRIASEAIALARARPSRSGSRPRISLQAKAAPPIAGRSSELVTAVLNLIVNAIDATEGRGTIDVRTGIANGEPYIEVRDNGPGMPPDVERRVGEPFFTTKGDEGTGLGVAMVYACAARHGGSVSLTTAPGRGTCFRLAFPLSRAA